MYRHIDLVSAAQGPEQDRLLGFFEERWIAEGVQVFPYLEGQSYCFVLLDGFVRKLDPVLGPWLLSPGDSFGLDELLVGHHPERSYHAVTRCTLLGLSKAALLELLNGQDALALNLQAELARLAGEHAQLRLARLGRRL
jgi:CRP-like cAMP-binding protein